MTKDQIKKDCYSPQICKRFWMTLKQYEQNEPWNIFDTSRHSLEVVIVLSSEESLRNLRRTYDSRLRDKSTVDA
ncbi:hypothetical protein DMR_09730 [Solidesulfovibrio magneticus RS-1]|uniref:Uncharacterized protein n=1 Tax=Solidesulfovibrio magneticus (strain ATCC 700980 / DSM 13731 / RS-1) TaxID=573370 RepID=C4XKS5_SOLM1|nr:hypothetical protein DMR_09730 [Solidesulfovibrio magneticus RS-1]